MKNKNTHSFRVNHRLFYEGRLLNAGGAPEAPDAAAEREKTDKAALLIKTIHGSLPIDGGDKPESILENNPFRQDLLDAVDKLEGYYLSFSAVKVDKDSLVLIFKDKKGAEVHPDIVLGDKQFKAIFWLEIFSTLQDIFRGHDIPDELIYKAANSKEFPKLQALIDAIAKDKHLPTTGAETIQKVIDELKSPELQTKIKYDASAARVRARADVEAEQLDADVRRGIESDIDGAFGVGPTQTEIDNERIDQWVMNVLREGRTVNAHKWKPETAEGLAAMRNEWIALGIPAAPGNPFYDKLFKQLSKSSDPAWLSPITDPNRKEMYLNPRDHLDELQEHDNAFYRSWKFYEAAVQNFNVLQDTGQNLTGDRIENLDRDPYATKIVDGLKQNWDKFSTAIRERDYATAGLYVVGIWALYRSLKELTKGKEGQVTKYLAYGLALYTGHIFLKNSGIDILKKLGLKDKEAEVMGTPLEGLARMNIPEAGDIDYAVYLRTSEINLKTLHKEYEKSNSKGVRFIDPALYPSEFPQFKHHTPAEAETDKEYRRVGEQLYLVIHCLQLGYDRTLKLDEGLEKYYGKSFTDVLYNDPVLKKSNVRQFTGVLLEYAPTKYKKSLFEPEALKKARERVVGAFAATDMAASLEPLEIDPEKHVTGGKIMNFPVVVIPDPEHKEYIIYAKKDYRDKKENIHRAKRLGAIPFEGSTATAVKDIRAAISQRMLEQITPIASTGGRIIKRPVYSRGKWEGEIVVPGAGKYDITHRQSTIELIPRDDGGITMKYGAPPVEVNLDYFMDLDFPHAGVLLAKMVADPENAALSPFYNSHSLRIIDELDDDATTGNPRFQIEVVGEKIPVTYDKSTRRFKVSKADQERLLDNPRFRREYVEGMMKMPRVNDAFENLEGVIDDAPEQFHLYFFEGAKKWFTSATKDSPFRGISNLDSISGSLPDYYTYSVLNAKRLELQYSLEGHLASAKTFKAVHEAETEVWADALAKLERMASTLIAEADKLQTQGKDWDREHFMLSIVKPLQRAGHKSRTYSDSLDSFEVSVMAKYGLKGSDIFEGPHNKLAHLKGVYAYYTAYLDRPDLDSVDYPADPILATKRDNDYYRIQYLEYVKNQVLMKASRFGDVLPEPEAWGIMDYKKWLESEKSSIAPLNPIDEKKPLEHDPDLTDPARNLTQLESYYADQMEILVKDLKQISSAMGEADPAAMDGWFEKFENGEGTDPNKSQLTQECNTIHGLYGHRRSEQMGAIDERIAIARMYILENEDFWLDISILDRLKLAFK